MIASGTGSSGALSSRSPPAPRGHPRIWRRAAGPVPAISSCWGFVFSSPVFPLPSPGTCKHRKQRMCLHGWGSASPCFCSGVMLSEHRGSRGTQGGFGDRLEELKRKHLLLGCSSACSAKVIPTFDFSRSTSAPGISKGLGKREGQNIMTRKRWGK